MLSIVTCSALNTIPYIKVYKASTQLLEACRACAAKEPVHELCTAHSARRRKKKGGHTNPDVRMIIIIYI